MLPTEFKNRMIKLLGDEADSFFDALENESAVKSFRVNSIKTSVEDFEKGPSEINRKKADFPPECYYTEEKFPGSFAAHHSGAIYMQDPSAMATVHAVKLSEGMKVLDSCSAPGGKTTQLAATVGDRGVVVANEYDTKRCRILQGNVERMGCRNILVVNLDTAVLAETYPDTFDVVLADAPCSGEGMFRKNSLAISEWSPQNVGMCVERQREILENVAKCVKKGGVLIYSTCTFSLEENEMNVERFLDTHKDFSLSCVESGLERVTRGGINFDGCSRDMSKTRRFYPHVSRGEGQFIAVMTRDGEPEKAYIEKDKKHKKEKERRQDAQTLATLAVAREFLEQNLVKMPEFELCLLGDNVYLKPEINLAPYGVFAAGVCVGEVVKGRLVPHHQLFSAYGNDFKRKICLDSNMSETTDYLRGMEIGCEGLLESVDEVTSGYAAVIIDGCATGGAKVSQNRAKNHYPKGLREQ